MKTMDKDVLFKYECYRKLGLNEWSKYNKLKIYISKIYFYIFSHATLNETFTAKYDGILPRTP